MAVDLPLRLLDRLRGWPVGDREAKTDLAEGQSTPARRVGSTGECVSPQRPGGVSVRFEVCDCCGECVDTDKDPAFFGPDGDGPLLCERCRADEPPEEGMSLDERARELCVPVQGEL